MYCKNCGKPLNGDEKFCSNCGTKIEYGTDVKSANDTQNEEKTGVPKNNMVWDLGDFEDKDKKEDSELSWNTDGLFMEVGTEKANAVKDNYKGPLMFRTDDKAPSREEIEQREKEEETTKKSSLYTEAAGLGKGNRWDISNVEIPKVHETENEEKNSFSWSLDEDDTGVNLRDKAANGFKSIGQLNAQNNSENKSEEDENQAKEQLQAVIDGAIEQAESEYSGPEYEKIEKISKPVEKEKADRIKPSEFSWSLGDDEEDEFPPIIASPKNPLEIQLKINKSEPIEMKYDDMEPHKEEPGEIDFNKEMTTEPGWNDVSNEETMAGTVKKQPEVVFDWTEDVALPDYHPGFCSEESKEKVNDKGIKKPVSQLNDELKETEEVIEEGVVDNNMSMTLEELAAGNLETDKVPESNYDDSRKTIRNVLSKNAREQKADFKTAELSNEDLKQEKCDQSKVVDIEQPKISNISLEIQEDEVTGEKVEKVLTEDPKAPAECCKSSGFTRKEINDDIRVADVGEPSIMDEVLPSAVDVLKNTESNPSEEETEKAREREKFYTFNKNKEEFQKLLEQEYKRLEGSDGESKGYESDIESFMDIHRGKNVEATSQIEEMNKARSVFVNGPSYDEINVYEDEDFKDEDIQFDMDELDKLAENEGMEKLDGVQVISQADNSKHEDAADDLTDSDIEKEAGEKSVSGDDSVTEKDEDDPVVVVFEPQKEESLVDTFIEKEQAKGKILKEKTDDDLQSEEPAGRKNRHDKKSDKKHNTKDDKISDSETNEEKADYLHGSVSKMIIDPSINSETERLANEFFEEDDDDQHKGGAKQVVLGFLTVIVILIIAVLGITIILPDSPVAKIMTDMGHKVVITVTDVFGGDDTKKEADKVDVRESALEDKTELIKAEIDRNYKNNIEEIVYDSELVYDPDATYELQDLKDAKGIQTVLWYKDDKGDPHYYDQEITGTIIEFVSMRNAWISKDDKSVFGVLNTGTKEYDKVEGIEKNNKKQVVDMLSIGDIKVAGNAYYVWTAETVNGKTKQHVYEIKEQDQKLYVNDHCDI